MNHKYRFRYQKKDEVKYVSHLDFIRVVERAMKRAHLPVAYSQGFNPHPLMAVAVPLSVGVTSQYDLMDIAFEEPQNIEDLIKKFNKALPDGFRILEAKELGDLAKFKYIDTAKYEIYVEYDDKTLPDLDAFMAQETILIEKKSKRSLKEVDIKPLIHEVRLEKSEGNVLTLYAVLAAGQVNVKPALLVEAIGKYQPDFSGEYLSACRLELYASQETCF